LDLNFGLAQPTNGLDPSPKDSMVNSQEEEMEVEEEYDDEKDAYESEEGEEEAKGRKGFGLGREKWRKTNKSVGPLWVLYILLFY